LIIGERLKDLREEKGFTQGEIEKRTGLLRCYISRVENGHTVPAVPTLEKMARALEVPMYRLFYGSQGPAEVPNVFKRGAEGSAWGQGREEARLVRKFRKLLSRIGDNDRKLLLTMAKKMELATRNAKNKKQKQNGRRPTTRRAAKRGRQ
jgi:transcriptional regulator with XRE-family HTH domain